MDKLESPIRLLRKKLSMSQRRFALLVGKSSGHLSDLEDGTSTLAPDIIAILKEAGVDVETLAEEHTEFMELRRKQLMAEVKAKLEFDDDEG